MFGTGKGGEGGGKGNGSRNINQGGGLFVSGNKKSASPTPNAQAPPSSSGGTFGVGNQGTRPMTFGVLGGASREQQLGGASREQQPSFGLSAQPVPSKDSSVFGSGAGFGGVNKKKPSGVAAGFGSAAAPAAASGSGTGARFGTGEGFGGTEAGFSSFAAATLGGGGTTGGGFGVASKTKSASSTPSWATVAATTTPSASGVGSARGFGSGGGFQGSAKTTGGAKSATAGASSRSFSDGLQSMSATSNTGFGGLKKPAVVAGIFGGYGGGGKLKVSATGTSFGADTTAGGKSSFAAAAKRGALSSAWTSSGSTFPSAAGVVGKTTEGQRPRSGGFAGDRAAASSSDQRTTSSGPWTGGFLTASGRAKAQKRAATTGDDGGGGSKGNDGSGAAPSKGSAGNKRDKNRASAAGAADPTTSAGSGGSKIMGAFGSTPPVMASSDAPTFVGGGRTAGAAGGSNTSKKATATGRSRIMGGFGAPPPRASSSTPGFVGGGESGGGAAGVSKGKRAPTTGSKILGGLGGGSGFGAGGVSKSRKAPAAGRSTIMGGFGDPPPEASSSPPAFVGGGGNGGAGGASKSKKAATTGRSRIMGGFGDPPPEASSSSPAFVGGGGSSAASGLDAVDAATKARRAQRFAGAGGGRSGVTGGGSTKGGGANSSSGAGSSGGGGSAEDVQRGSHLDDAKIKQGTVEAMCPPEEMSRRVPGDLHILEKEHPDFFMPDQGDGGPPRVWLHDDLVVKRHQRAAAGMDISKPELLRTPLWLARTVDHLVMNCVDKGPHGGGDPALVWEDPRIQEYMAKFRANNPSRADSAEEETEHDLYNFVWDRFRMVRSDYNMQGYNPVVGLVSEASIVAHERMARWYVLMANRMEKNSMQTHRFNLKSIVETLKKLYEFYTIRVSRGEVSGGLASPNEPEIMAYYLLTVLEQDGGIEVQRLVKDLVRSRREEVLDSPEIKGALKVVRAWHAGDYVTFFRAFRQQGVMHRCLMSQYVKPMRDTAIKVIAQSFADFSTSELMRLLCFESEDQAVDFLMVYSLKVSRAGQVHLRTRDQNGRWTMAFKHPAAMPEPPPLQDLVEPKPWRLASEWVCKDDYEPSADKSHDVTAAPRQQQQQQQQQQSDGAKGAAALRRVTSSSSTGSASGRGGGSLRSMVAGKVAVPRRPSISQTSPSPAHLSSSGGTGALSGGGDRVAPSTGSGAGKAAASTFPPFGSPGTKETQAFSNKPLSGQPPTTTQQGASVSSLATSSPATPLAARGGFVFAPHSPAPSSKSKAQDAPVGKGPNLGTPTPPLAFPPLASTIGAELGSVAGASSTVAAGKDASLPSDSAGGVQGGQGPGAGVATGGTVTASIAPVSTFAPAPSPTPPQAGSSTPAAVAAAAPAKRRKSPVSPPSRLVGNAASTGDGLNVPHPASRGQAKRDRKTPTNTTPAGTSPAEGAAANAALAAAQQAVREDAKRAMDDRQRRQKAEAEEARRKELAAARKRAAQAAAAAAEETKRVRDAESRTERALAAGRLVPSDVVDKLPDGRLRRSALEHRKKSGLRLAQLETAVLRRRRSAAWGVWFQETRSWVEEQHLMELVNRRSEERSALTEEASILRKTKKRRSLSFNDTGSGVLGETKAGAAATAAADTEANRHDVFRSGELRKPQPLDVAAVVSPGVAKNQGEENEEAFRAVGLTTVWRPGTKAREWSSSPANSLLLPAGGLSPSPPHLFWKAVVVAPSHTRGNVGAWLEAKFGGSAAGGGAEGMSAYRRELVSHGLYPELDKGVMSGAEDQEESSCGSSGTSKLILRELRELRTTTPARSETSSAPPQWIHLCVQRISVHKGCRLEPSSQLSEKLKAASVVVFAATPRDQDRFFWSPLHPKPDWSQAKAELRLALESASPRVGGTASIGVPLLVVIPVKDSALQRDAGCADQIAFDRTRERILEDAWEGLGLREVAQYGCSFRVALVGLHEFESRSKAAAASGAGVVFAGSLEDACSEDVAGKLAELAERAPRHPLVATRCLQELLNTAVSRATTDDRYADAVGLTLPPSRYEDPPLGCVVEAANRATEHVCHLLVRRSSAWPIAEFAATATVVDERERREMVYVPGAARAAGGEIAGSPLDAPDSATHVDTSDAGRLKTALEASGALPLDWETVLPSFGMASRTNPGFAGGADVVLRAAFLPPIPPKLAEAFSPNVLAGREGARPLGPEVAWNRVEELEAYLGRGLMAQGLRLRLAEALAGGVMMKGPPPPWRTLVRDAIARRVVLARSGEGEGSRPLVVHFVASFGQDSLEGETGRGEVPRLLEAEIFGGPSLGSNAVAASEERVLAPSRDPTGNTELVGARASATLKRTAPLLVDSRPDGAKHRRTSSCSTPNGSGRNSSRRRFFGSSSGSRSTALKFDDGDDVDRLLSEGFEGIALETEEIKTSRERATSFAAADRDLDTAFLASIGVSLAGSSRSGRGGGALPSFDLNRVTALPRGLTKQEKARTDAEKQAYEARQRQAAATLSAADYRCWEIREEMGGYRRQEKKIRAQILDGDPLLPLYDESGCGVDRGGLGASPF